MDALTLMQRDHETLKQLLERASEEERPETREDLLATIRAELAAHEAMEEQVFYPALRRHDEAKDLVLEGFEEHHVADVLLDELTEVRAATDTWKAKMKVLKENIEHHIEEEEGDMFDVARKVLAREELEELGTRMAAVKGAPPER
jgi:iron-sulfur cluster repair protein YtfE (RIC family)